MEKTLLLKKLKKGTILRPKFESLTANNEIIFSKQGIAIIYAPNGGGKTTIAKIFQRENLTDFVVEFDGTEYSSMTGEPLFHVINDQISRNIINGTTDEFVLGEDIAKERQKKVELDREYQSLFDIVKEKLKNDYKIVKQSTPFINNISEADTKSIINTIGKKGSKASDVDMEKFISAYSTRAILEIPDFTESCMQFYLDDMSDKDTASIIQKICGTALDQIGKSEEIRDIDRNNTAINILKKYKELTFCIVCETKDIVPADIIERKEKSNKAVYSTLNPETKKVFDKIIASIKEPDPFNIREILTSAIETGEVKKIMELIDLFAYYQAVAEKLANNEISGLVHKSALVELYTSYKSMFENKLELHEDDELLIKDIIAESLGRKVVLERDSEKNIIIKLEDKKLIGTECKDFHLSTGEQNFISLAFELLKAKNVSSPIIVMDDPISSFDSIYKNKIAYCIVKILEQKQQIIFTHNIELVRLLDVQKTHCFSLYLLGNDSDETCGFIPVLADERSILLYLDKLMDYLRSAEADANIIDERMYIISLIPFMRAVIKIINPDKRNEFIDSLTSLMHGYDTEIVDITSIYNSLFGKTAATTYQISAQDIIKFDIDKLNFVSDKTYPLLAKTLKHTLTYLFLRLNVEKVLRDKFPQETKNCELLGEFIYKALSDKKYQGERVRLTSKKTLLNEFNHYEGNFNIFQPAIDISDTNLAKEKKEILQILDDIKAKK
ncbi:MAG: AAA family ATPase [Saccharofermentanales bacterium]